MIWMFAQKNFVIGNNRSQKAIVISITIWSFSVLIFQT